MAAAIVVTLRMATQAMLPQEVAAAVGAVTPAAVVAAGAARVLVAKATAPARPNDN